MNRALVDPGLAERQRFMRMGNTDKLGLAIRHAGLRLPAQARDHAMALVDPGNLAIMAGALAIWVGAQATPVGWVVNIAMMGVGVAAVGAQAVDVAREIRDFALGVLSADNTADLRAAGDHLAKAVAMVGVDLVVALLLKKAIVKVREPKMPKLDSGETKLLFGKYDPRTAQRGLPPEKPKLSTESLKPVKPSKNAVDRRAYLNQKFGRTGHLDTDINIAGNKATVRQYAQAHGMNQADASALMSGIDLTKPVEVVKINTGKSMWQFQSPGAPQGKWYSMSPNTTPSELGIGTYGINRQTMAVEKKMLNTYTTNHPVEALRSTAKPIEDHWSIAPYGSFQTQGGATQFFAPQKGSFTLN